MRKLAIGIVAAGTLMAAAPAMAQVAIEGPGVGIHVGPQPYYRDHHRWDRGYRDGYHSYAWRERGCRTVTVRERLPDGRVVVRTRERC
jgi:hypothetical protein